MRQHSGKTTRNLLLIAFVVVGMLAIGVVVAISTRTPGDVAAQQVPKTKVVKGIPTPTNEQFEASAPEGREPLRISRTIEQSSGASAQQQVAESAARLEFEEAMRSGQQVAYLEAIDRVIYAPPGFTISIILSGAIGGGNLGCPPKEFVVVERCPVGRLYVIRDSNRDEAVTIDSTGHVYESNSDTLPAGFEFLSEFPVHNVDYASLRQ